MLFVVWDWYWVLMSIVCCLSLMSDVNRPFLMTDVNRPFLMSDVNRPFLMSDINCSFLMSDCQLFVNYLCLMSDFHCLLSAKVCTCAWVPSGSVMTGLLGSTCTIETVPSALAIVWTTPDHGPTWIHQSNNQSVIRTPKQYITITNLPNLPTNRQIDESTNRRIDESTN